MSGVLTFYTLASHFEYLSKDNHTKIDYFIQINTL